MQSCRQASFAKITDISLSGPVVNNNTFVKCQKTQCCTENYAPIVVRELPNDSSSSTTSTSLTLPTEDSTDDSSSSPATTPSSSSLGTRSRDSSKKTHKKGHRSSTGRFARKVGRLHRKSSGGRSASIKRCTSEHYS